MRSFAASVSFIIAIGGGCSLSEKRSGKRAIFPPSARGRPVVVIYLTPISVSTLIDVRHGRYPTAPRPCDGNFELAGALTRATSHAQMPAAQSGGCDRG
jgi:hypothetical protein